MSAPLVVNTRDGACWTRRTVTAGGIALYAPEAVKTCPEFVMATLEDLAAHGIQGSVDALPMPVGLAPQDGSERAKVAELLGDVKPATDALLVRLGESVRDRREHEHPTWEDLYCLNLVSWMGERMGPVLRRLLDAEDRIERRRSRLIALQNDAMDMRGSLSPNGEARKVPFELGETLTPAVDWLIARVAELEAAQGTVYRAEHPDSGITLGHYSTAKAAREHCEETERRSWPTGTTLAFDWIEDDEDRIAELVVTAGQNEESVTGYIVTALELDSEYDAEAAE